MKHEELQSRLEELCAFLPNWNGEKADPPNDVAKKNACSVLSYMKAHHLESSIVVPEPFGGLGFVWIGEYNQAHEASISCYNDGSVTAFSADGCDDNWKFWWIKNYVMPTGTLGETIPAGYELQLSIEETLEFIRHWIWANHTI